MRINVKRFSFLLVVACLLNFSTIYGANVSWSGNESGIFTDDQIFIDGNVTLTANTFVQAITTDVVITVSGDYFIKAAQAGNIRFYLETATDHKITFSLDNYTLTFKGAEVGASAEADLLILARGLSGGVANVEFVIPNGEKVIFTRNDDGLAAGGGAKYYMLMDGATGATVSIPQTVFSRQDDSSSTENVTIEIGADSLLGYLSTQAIYDTQVTKTAEGVIIFDATNLAAPDAGIMTGRMILDIADKGAVIVSGRYVDDVTNPALSNVYTATPAGCQAKLFVDNSTGETAYSSLLILNRNNTWYEFLYDPWGNLNTRDSNSVANVGSFTGLQYGFVLGTNGVHELDAYSYCHYMGLANDMCPSVTTAAEATATCTGSTGCDCSSAVSYVKMRNPSAYVVDGYNNAEASPAFMKMNEYSCFVFSNGVDCNGGIESSETFTVSTDYQTPGAGEMVFDVEGPLTVIGDATYPTKLEILSRQVEQTGENILYDDSTVLLFPERLFNDNYYNKAYFFINNTMNLCHTYLVHTDENHYVAEKNAVSSEPSYVGGETYKVFEGSSISIDRPTISYYNSFLHVHTSIAFTGVDQLVSNGYICGICSCETPTQFRRINKSRITKDTCCPDSSSSDCWCDMPFITCPDVTTTCDDNVSEFVFFSNGFKCDNGVGRQMILGTAIGSLGCDCCTVVNKDSHLDIMQCSHLASDDCTTKLHRLDINTGANNDQVIECLTKDVSNECSIHTIYLSNCSNISIGTYLCSGDTDTYGDRHTDPTLNIEGNYIAIETAGGPTQSPETTGITGCGGVFVDCHGTFSLAPDVRVSINTMVTRSCDGQLYLPDSQVYWGPRVGISDWRVDVSSGDMIITASTESLAEYTLYWLDVIKSATFVPYGGCSFDLCTCSVITSSSINNLPTVKGEIQQLQIKESLFAFPAHVKISGDQAWVQELVFLSGFNSGEAPAAVIILEDNGTVGLGTRHRDVDSLSASIVLGVNGVTIIANGSGAVDFNEDVIVNNVCHILKGPDYATTDRLVLSASEEKILTIKNGACLDLSSFGEGYSVEVGGELKLVFEPGAQLVLGGGTLIFSDYSEIYCEPLTDKKVSSISASNTSLADLDPYRVKISGTGTILMQDKTRTLINRGAFVGIEATQTGTCDDYCPTAITWQLTDEAKIYLGYGIDTEGGALQVGNSTDITDCTVSFTLLIDGEDAAFIINKQAFFGTGVGIVQKTDVAPNSWVVAPTYNVENITIDIENGKFVHSQIYLGTDLEASLFAVGAASSGYTLFINLVNDALAANVSSSVVQGGGNFKLVTAQGNPTVANVTNSTTGILASKPLLYSTTYPTNSTAQVFFDFWKTQKAYGSAPTTRGRADAGPGLRNQFRIGYVDGTYIARVARVQIIGTGSIFNQQESALEMGAVSLDLKSGSAPREISEVWSLQ